MLSDYTNHLVFLSVFLGCPFIFQTVYDYHNKLPNAGEGYAAPGWYKVAQVFKKQIENGVHSGGGFAIYHRGALVMEFFGGYADYDAEWRWGKDTLAWLHTGTNTISAIALAVLADRELLDFASPVSRYWAEFGQNGKELITVDQLISHQVGLVLLDEKFSLFDLSKKRDFISELLASAKPRWKLGSGHGYHTVTMGLYMDELVRRVDPHHRSIDQFFADEIARPFGIDCFVGLPKQESHRCSRTPQNRDPMGGILSLLQQKFHSILLWFRGEELLSTEIANSYVEGGKILYNNPLYRAIPSPSTHGFCSVTGLAKLFGILANGGRDGDRSLVSSETLQKFTHPLVAGNDLVYRRNMTMGRGISIISSTQSSPVFGHTGVGGQIGLADPEHELGWAYVSSDMSPDKMLVDDPHYLSLVDAMYESVIELKKKENHS